MEGWTEDGQMDWLVMVMQACNISILHSVGQGWKTREYLRLAWPTYGDPVFLSPKQRGTFGDAAEW